MTSKDGIHWSEWKDLSHLGVGHYQTSSNQADLIGTSFNYHPDRKVRGGLNYRTNLYYLQSKDFGKTWQTVDGSPIELPLKDIDNKALVQEYDSKWRNVYICDVNFDKKGNPVILYLTSKGPTPGAKYGPREWHTAWWTGKQWELKPFTTSDSNYDMGSIYIEKSGIWKIIAPTETGPQSYNPGGEMVMWVSKNKGKTWKKAEQLTGNSEFNHTYARRPVNAHPGFYAFWADGNGRQPSKSRLYFSDKEGNVFVLPEKMTGETEKPYNL
ncbi:MAG: BNR-4 repeat-containing protein [Mangrovibacterium sp.]